MVLLVIVYWEDIYGTGVSYKSVETSRFSLFLNYPEIPDSCFNFQFPLINYILYVLIYRPHVFLIKLCYLLLVKPDSII